MRSVEMPRRNDPLAKETHWFIRSEAEKVYVCPAAMAHQIKEFSNSEKSKLSQDIQTGKSILDRYLQNNSEKISANLLDKAFKAWAQKPDEFSHEQIANGLGSLFGELIKTEFQFSWKMIEDDLGVEAALIDEITGSIVFPINTIWKRIEPELNTEPFFEPMFKTIRAHLDNQKAKKF
ncbi:MAG: hypothetical protein Kow0029_00010 [Candidatus Rifleibacteriota bacterium]